MPTQYPRPDRTAAANICRVADILLRARRGLRPLPANQMREDQVDSILSYANQLRYAHTRPATGPLYDPKELKVGDRVRYLRGRCHYIVRGTVRETGALLIEIRTAPLPSEAHRVGQLFTAEPWRLCKADTPAPQRTPQAGDKVVWNDRADYDWRAPRFDVVAIDGDQAVLRRPGGGLFFAPVASLRVVAQ